PAPLEAERRIDLAALGAIIGVALLVLADPFAKPPRPQLRAEGLAVPPGEEFEPKLLHELLCRFEKRDAVMPSAHPIVQMRCQFAAILRQTLARAHLRLLSAPNRHEIGSSRSCRIQFPSCRFCAAHDRCAGSGTATSSNGWVS